MFSRSTHAIAVLESEDSAMAWSGLGCPEMRPKISAILVTKGEESLSAIIDQIVDAVDEIVIWDNSQEEDLSGYGRYAAIVRAKHDVIYVQDGDCLVDSQLVINHYQPGVITSNVPESFRDSCFFGWGAIFDRGLPDKAFDYWHNWCLTSWEARALHAHQIDNHVFYRTCDLIFGTLTTNISHDFGFKRLLWEPERITTQHESEQTYIHDLARRARRHEQEGEESHVLAPA